MRILKYIVLIFTIILWLGGLSTTVLHWFYDAGFVADDYRFGDLYRLSALPQFKQAHPECELVNRSSDTASTQLYLIGDSFSEPKRIGKSDFRVSYFQRVAWDNQQKVQLNPVKRNVLILESVERHVREHFAKHVNEFVISTDTAQAPAIQQTLRQRLSHDWHRTDVEERLESTLFSQTWAFWVKELKASLTLNWFDRASASVSLSKDNKQVFLSSDTDAKKPLNSSFSPLTDREVSMLVDSINAVADRYRKLGFETVYLSLIPNKASILEPHRAIYNHLIERIQTHPNLKVPIIDTYNPFRNSPQSPYLKSDTHWTCEGRATWLNSVRDEVGI